MRIAVYKDNLSTGRGADRAVRNFAEGLNERGIEAVLFEKAELRDRLAEKWDAVVATGSNEIVDLDRLGYFGRTDAAHVVLQLHLAPRGFFKWRHPLRNLRIRRAFDKARAVQVLCSDYVEEFRRLAPHPQVRVIGNYTEMPPVAEGDDRREAIILYPAAALNAVKNQKLLIRAFAMVAGEYPAWRLRLLGKDTTGYARECRCLAKKLGVEERVDFVGFTHDLDGEYARAAFVAFPSTLEGFPLAVLEAARHRLACVAHRDLPGIGDIVTRDTGIVTAATAGEYAAGLGRLMADEALRRRLGEGAARRNSEVYGKDRIMGEWVDFLSSICA